MGGYGRESGYICGNSGYRGDDYRDGPLSEEMNPSVYVAAVEPAGSPVLSGGAPGPHGIQGIGAGSYRKYSIREFTTKLLRQRKKTHYRLGKAAAREEGFLTGISSGAALWAAVVLGRRPENEGKRIVAVLPDTGERYLSTELFR